LKVIYDAAHCFGVKLNGKSILLNGDISTLSFHATKIFHTAEGGAIICRDNAVADRIALMKKFGHIGEEDYIDLGINAKMSELHAAMGLTVLPYMDHIISERKRRSEIYQKILEGTGLRTTKIPDNVDYNYAYFPVVFNDHEQMMNARQALIENGIMPRRYFYPSLNKLKDLFANSKTYDCIISEEIADTVMCLPLYDSLEDDDIEKIIYIIKDCL